MRFRECMHAHEHSIKKKPLTSLSLEEYMVKSNFKKIHKKKKNVV